MEFPRQFTVRTITARRIILAPEAPRGKFGEDRAPFQPSREVSACAEPGFAGIAIGATAQAHGPRHPHPQPETLRGVRRADA